MSRMKVVDDSDSPEAAAARARWEKVAPPNAKPTMCEGCGGTFVIVCQPSEFATCGRYWAKQGQATKVREVAATAETPSVPVKRGRGRPRKNPVETPAAPPPVKRGRGRPRKNS